MNNETDALSLAKRNKRRAAVAMWSVSLLLIAVTILSELSSLGISYILSEYGQNIERAATKVLVLLGAESRDAFTAVKYIMGSVSFSYVLSMVTTLVSFVLPAVLFSRAVKVGFDESFNLRGKLLGAFVPMYCLCHLFTTVSSVFSGAISEFLLPGADEIYRSYTGVAAQSFNVYEFVITVLCSAVFVPMTEEYVFRGVIYSYLKRYGTVFGVVASAVVFGVAHTSPTQSVYAFVFGMLLALVFEVTGNIKTSIAFHGINNFITVVLGYLMGEVSTGVFNLVSSMYLLVFSGFGIFGVYALCKKDGIYDTFRAKAEENEASLCEKPGMAQIAVLPLIVYLCYYVYSVVTTVM